MVNRPSQTKMKVKEEDLVAPEKGVSQRLETFTQERATLLGADWSSLEPMRELTRITDEFVGGLATDFRGTALVAIGGYGRRELGPYSDLDVLLLHKPRLAIEHLTETLWYPIWDSTVGLDYSVRTVAQAVRIADSDARALLGMLDARLICGDEVLFRTLVKKIRDRFINRLDRYRVIFKGQSETRRIESGEIAFLLEPDIKESHGGLRDLLTLKHLVDADPDRLGDREKLLGSRELLLRVRNVVQARSLRPQNRLYLQDQDAIAAELQFRDADQLMYKIAEAGRFISRSLDENFRVPLNKRPLAKNLTDEWGAIPKGVFSHGTEICLDPAALSYLDASVIIKMAAVSLSLGMSLCIDGLELCADRLQPLLTQWEPSTVAALVTLFSFGDESIALLERLDHYGLLDKVIPEWERVRYLPQRNAYHTFTVDRHLIEAGVAAGRLRRQVARPDLLIISALLHDIGKGLQGDHSHEGASIARGIAMRMGLSDADVETIVRLVDNHLLLVDTATRRDVSDPKTVKDVATALVDTNTLELLRVLTEADSKATGPAAWSHWKEELLDKLFQATEAYMRGERSQRSAAFPGEYEVELIKSFDGSLIVAGRSDDLWIVAPDEVGLFAKITGTLAVMGLSILSADVYSRDGVAIERFRVSRAYGREPNWVKFESELRRTLADPSTLDMRIQEKAKSTGRRRKVAESAKILPRVTIHSEASDRATVVEVCGPDSLGLLFKLTSVLASHALDVIHAKVLTIGDDVVDTFYVVNSNGERFQPEEIFNTVRRDLLEVVER